MSVVFVLNVLSDFAEGYIITYLAIKVTGEYGDVWRLISSGCVCGIFGLVAPYLDAGLVPLYEATTYALALLVGKERFVAKEYFTSLATVILILLARLGVVDMLPDVIPFESEICKIIGDAMLISVMIVASFVCKKDKHQQAKEKDYFCDLEVLCPNGKVIKCKGYLDSGNTLYDGKMPVCVIAGKLADSIGASSHEELAVTTVTGVTLMKKVPIEFKVYFKNGTNKLYRTVGVVSPQLDGKNYKVLLHKDMMIGG